MPVARAASHLRPLRQELPGVAVEVIVLHHSDNSLTERLQGRGLWTPEGGGSQADTQRELKWLELFDQYFCDEAKAHPLPLTSV